MGRGGRGALSAATILCSMSPSCFHSSLFGSALNKAQEVANNVLHNGSQSGRRCLMFALRCSQSLPLFNVAPLFSPLCACLTGGQCQSSSLRGSGNRLPHQHAVRVPAVGADLPAGEDPAGVQRGAPPALHDPAGLCSPGAQYPPQPQTDAGLRACQVHHNTGA